MTLLMKWCSYTSLLTLSLSWSCLECCVCVFMWPSKIFRKSYCFEIPRTFMSFLAWLVNRSPSKVWLCCQVRSFWHTFSGQRVGFVPKPYLTLFLSKGISCFTCAKVRFLWIYYPSNLWFEIGLSSNQNQSQGLSWWCFYLWFSLEYIIIPFSLTNNFALFRQHMSPYSWKI
jgi:hypothetical protein